jgi:phosphoglycolate phosphatase-like HAD superfamily hydrolase
MARLGFGKYFVDQCVSESVRAYKPADLFISYLRKYSLDREDRCYFIGDTKNDIIAGQKLGVHTVLVDRQGHGNSHSAEYVVRSLNELLTILGME